MLHGATIPGGGSAFTSPAARRSATGDRQRGSLRAPNVSSGGVASGTILSNTGVLPFIGAPGVGTCSAPMSAAQQWCAGRVGRRHCPGTVISSGGLMTQRAASTAARDLGRWGEGVSSGARCRRSWRHWALSSGGASGGVASAAVISNGGVEVVSRAAWRSTIVQGGGSATRPPAVRPRAPSRLWPRGRVLRRHGKWDPGGGSRAQSRWRQRARHDGALWRSRDRLFRRPATGTASVGQSISLRAASRAARCRQRRLPDDFRRYRHRDTVLSNGLLVVWNGGASGNDRQRCFNASSASSRRTQVLSGGSPAV